jgi:Putative inner membrane exporter, YdcZ
MPFFAIKVKELLPLYFRDNYFRSATDRRQLAQGNMQTAIANEPLPSGARLTTAPWWVWVGGGLGALYVAAD